MDNNETQGRGKEGLEGVPKTLEELNTYIIDKTNSGETVPMPEGYENWSLESQQEFIKGEFNKIKNSEEIVATDQNGKNGAQEVQPVGFNEDLKNSAQSLIDMGFDVAKPEIGQEGSWKEAIDRIEQYLKENNIHSHTEVPFDSISPVKGNSIFDMSIKKDEEGTTLVMPSEGVDLSLLDQFLKWSRSKIDNGSSDPKLSFSDFTRESGINHEEPIDLEKPEGVTEEVSTSVVSTQPELPKEVETREGFASGIINKAKDWLNKTTGPTKREIALALGAMVAGAGIGSYAGLNQERKVATEDLVPDKNVSMTLGRIGFRSNIDIGKISTNPNAAQESPEKEKKASLLEDISLARHTVMEGDSLWKLLEKTLDNISDFQNMTKAQRANVIGNLANVVLQDPSSYGVETDGGIVIGKTVDFSKMFESDVVVPKFLGRAGSIQPGSERETTVLKTIGDMEYKVKNGQSGEAPKPEGPTPVKKETLPTPKPPVTTMGESFGSGVNNDNLESSFDKEEKPVPEFPKVEPAKDIDREKLAREIEEHRKELAGLEGGSLRSMNNDVPQDVLEGIRNDVNQIYGKPGVLGLGKKEGVETKEWKYIAGLPAKAALEFYMGEDNTNLSQGDKEALSQSKSNMEFLNHLRALSERADIRPFENGETVEDFFRRVGKGLLRT